MMNGLTFYGRVSTDSEEQKNSIRSQVSFYDDHIKDNGYIKPDTGYFYKRDGSFERTEGYYIDEGFSGAKSNKYRRAFQQMIKDASLGKFSVILCKNINRFGRNTKEILQAIDELRTLNIAVVFDDLKINTLNRADDFKLTIFAAQAQEESRAKSESVQFGKKQGYKKGIWGGREPYGYNLKNGKLVKNDYEAEIVKRIFDLYHNGCLGLHVIAQILNGDKIPTKRGSALWEPSLISKMLINSIYTGEIRLHRTKKIDINQNLIKNIPIEDQIILHDEELRIMDDETFKMVQFEKAKRYGEFGNFYYTKIKVENENGKLEEKKVRTINRGSTRHSSKHIFSNILKCGNCRGSLRRKVQKNKNRTFTYWFCRNNDRYGEAKCSYRNLQYEDNLLNYVKEEINKYKTDKLTHEKNLNYLIKANIEVDEIDKKVDETNIQIKDLKEERDLNFKLLSKKSIEEDEFEERNKRINTELKEAESRLNRLINVNNEIEETKLKYKHFIKFLNEIDTDNLTNATLRKIVSSIKVQTPIGIRPVERFQEHVFKPEYVEINWNFMGISEESLLKDYVTNVY